MRSVLLMAMMIAAPAWGADADPFQPSGSLLHGTGTLQGEYPRLAQPGLSAGLLSWIVEDPVVYGYPDGREEPILSSAFATSLYGGYTIGSIARVEALVPVYPYTDVPETGFQGVALGDIELRGLVPLVDVDDAFALAVRPVVGLPTGTADAYLRTGAHLGLDVVLGGLITEDVGWVGNLSITGAAADALPALPDEPDAIERVTTGSEFEALAGAWYSVEEGFRVGGDLRFIQGLARLDDTVARRMVDLHGFAQIASRSGISLTAGGGAGVGVGAPEYRLFASLGYAPMRADADGDGVADDDDACPHDPEDRDGFEDADGCPDPDNDGDGLADIDDACPDAPEDRDGFEDADGCPDPDNDGDGVLDVDDQCPDLAGPADRQGCADTDEDGVFDDVDACPQQPGTPAAEGCPDADGDLVPDGRDECPDEPIADGADPAFSDGCPSLAFVSEDRIVIDERVHFESGSARLSPTSEALLGHVARILREHPRIDLLEVAGHTDNTGDPDDNIELSKDRAEAVAIYLTEQGVDPSRLMPEGYGQTEPVDTNRTEAGRANNRRIEFVVRRWAEDDASPGGADEGEVRPADESPWDEGEPTDEQPAEGGE